MAPKCPKCQKSVYFAEEVRAMGMAWHKPCLSCTECKKSLNPSSICDDKDGNVYCKPCYGKLHGPTGYGYGGGAGVLSTNKYAGGDSSTSSAPAPKPASKPSPSPSKPAVSSSSGAMFCTKCDSNKTGKFCDICGSILVDAKSCAASAPSKSPSARPAKTPSKFGGGDKCVRCSKTVYEMEKVMSLGSIFHKTCFKCKSCSTSLSKSTLCDREGEIFCKPCYGKEFGPKGYGFGGGAGTLTHTE